MFLCRTSLPWNWPRQILPYIPCHPTTSGPWAPPLLHFPLAQNLPKKLDNWCWRPTKRVDCCVNWKRYKYILYIFCLKNLVLLELGMCKGVCHVRQLSTCFGDNNKSRWNVVWLFYNCVCPQPFDNQMKHAGVAICPKVLKFLWQSVMSGHDSVTPTNANKNNTECPSNNLNNGTCSRTHTAKTTNA